MTMRYINILFIYLLTYLHISVKFVTLRLI